MEQSMKTNRKGKVLSLFPPKVSLSSVQWKSTTMSHFQQSS